MLETSHFPLNHDSGRKGNPSFFGGGGTISLGGSRWNLRELIGFLVVYLPVVWVEVSPTVPQ